MAIQIDSQTCAEILVVKLMKHWIKAISKIIDTTLLAVSDKKMSTLLYLDYILYFRLSSKTNLKNNLSMVLTNSQILKRII